eukprot:TRINITY_DN6634_c0_g1_i2.p1 TRINITY_DN6634_c0_g1~~TRINITY_DN6634_c0_g1_i2.p1  ORF type:complete len:280 (+),score=83.86 TRINITY_DN6634_c0_g1_i2:1-840(+)
MNLINKGIEYLNIAIKDDENNKYENALENYIKSFEYLMTGLKYIEKGRMKDTIIQKIKEFIPRAEKLKEIAESQRNQTNIQRNNNKKLKFDSSNNNNENGFQKDIKGGSPPSHLRKTIEESIVMSKSNEVNFDSVIGLEKAKEALVQAVILPQKFPHAFQGKRKAWNAILMYGPPGTGKSYLAQATSSIANATFFSLSSSDLLCKQFGESEKLIKELFKIAEEKKPSIIFIDEIDALCGDREKEGMHEASKRLLTELMTRMSNLQDGVLVLEFTFLFLT